MMGCQRAVWLLAGMVLVTCGPMGTADITGVAAGTTSDSDRSSDPASEIQKSQLGGLFVPQSVAEVTTAVRTYWRVLDMMMKKYPDK